jgi:hypothetical protein
MHLWKQYLKQIWSFIRHVLAIRGILQWIGVWNMTISLLSAACVAIWSYARHIPGPYALLIALAVFAIVVIVWRAFSIKRIWIAQEFTASTLPMSATLSAQIINPTSSNRATPPLFPTVLSHTDICIQIFLDAANSWMTRSDIENRIKEKGLNWSRAALDKVLEDSKRFEKSHARKRDLFRLKQP